VGKGAPKWGGLLGCRAAAPPKTPKLKFRKHFVDIMVSKVLGDYPSAEMNH
jgi:hypothetical protein